MSFIDTELELHRRALRGRAASGLPSDVDAPGELGADERAIQRMPSNGRLFHYQQAVNCPAPGTNDFAVLSFRVPTGWRAVIKTAANLYTAAGFEEGSGDLIWRIAVERAYLPGFDAITTTLGSAAQPRSFDGAILAGSNQLVEYLVSVSASASFGTGAAAKIICHLGGWFYPQA